MKNVQLNLYSKFGKELYDVFIVKLKDLAFNDMSVSEWEIKWNELADLIGVHHNILIVDDSSYFYRLYETKSYWAVEFQGDTVDLGIRTTQRGESMNSLTKRFLTARTTLKDVSTLLREETQVLKIAEWKKQTHLN
jgi:hypothetical protein